MGQFLHKPLDNMLDEALQAQKADPHPKQVSTAIRTNYHQVINWSPQKVVPYLGLSIGLWYWQVRHPEGAIAMSVFLSGSPCSCVHVGPLSLLP